MAYTKQTWANGDLITADKLNHMEDGIAQTGGIVNVGASVNANPNDPSHYTATLDKTFAEIKSSYEAGTKVFLSYTAGSVSHKLEVVGYAIYTNSCSLFSAMPSSWGGTIAVWISDSADSYPYYSTD